MEEVTQDAVSQVFSAGRVVSLLVLWVVGWTLLRLAETVMERLAAYLPRRRLALNRVVPVLRIFTWSTVVYIAVGEILEPPRETLLALAASGGLAVGLAAQDLVKNVMSGLLILFERSFQVGDTIDDGSARGEVISIGLRSTRLRTPGDDVVTVPNGRLLESSISNATQGALHRQVRVQFTLPGHLDVVEVKRLAMKAAQNSPYSWLQGSIEVFVEDVFDRSFLTRYTLRCYVIDMRLTPVFESDLIERIKRAVIERGWVDASIVLPSLGAIAPPTSAATTGSRPPGA